MIYATLAAASAAAAATVESATSAALLDDTHLRLICITGSLGGAVLSVLLFPQPKTTSRTMAMKLLTSGLSGILFAPKLLTYMGWMRDTDTVLAISAIVSLLSIGVLRIAIPTYTKLIGQKLGAFETEQRERSITTIETAEPPLVITETIKKE